jgi:Fe-Mn family superoxide dismutase
MRSNKSENKEGRRDFIKKGSGAFLALSLSSSFVGSTLFSSCTPMKIVQTPALNDPALQCSFQQTPLSYSYNALEPYIDKETMEIHYTKHAAAYARSFAEAMLTEKVEGTLSVEAILGTISNYSPKMRNNAGGHYNHELFWKLMSPTPKSKPTGPLLTALEKQFGSYEAFVTAFEAQAKQRFGSGWTWLLIDKGNLIVCSTPNQDNPLMDVAEFKGFPLLGLDVWEHAYYLKYQNKRPDYISQWWKVVDWAVVEKRFAAASLTQK